MELDRSCRDWFEGSGIELREDCQEKVLEMGMFYGHVHLFQFSINIDIFWVKN